NVYALRFLLLFLPLALMGLAIVFFQDQWFTLLIAGISIAALLSITPRIHVWSRRQRRVAEIRRGLTDLLDMLCMCLEGGMALLPSLRQARLHLREYPSLQKELRLIERQAEVGSLERALQQFARRLNLVEARQVASLLTRYQVLGGQSTRLLLEQADQFRIHRKQEATRIANRSPIWLTFPLVFCFAPSVLILLIGPALMQMDEFFNPREGTPNYLENSEQITAGQNFFGDEVQPGLPNFGQDPFAERGTGGDQNQATPTVSSGEEGLLGRVGDDLLLREFMPIEGTQIPQQ
ncbi:MAG: type II secretion system F family protein, partial [Pirellulaceae bacterium]|nr:type II secretion system F family protein [Pirellulaceae bacterium]